MIAVSGKKKLRIRKYPDTCGRGLSDMRNAARPVGRTAVRALKRQKVTMILQKS